MWEELKELLTRLANNVPKCPTDDELGEQGCDHCCEDCWERVIDNYIQKFKIKGEASEN